MTKKINELSPNDYAAARRAIAREQHKPVMTATDKPLPAPARTMSEAEYEKAKRKIAK